MPLQSFVSEFLTFLEKREERLLSWGFYNVRWTSSDIEVAMASEASEALRNHWQEIEGEGQMLRPLLQNMQQRNLLYLVPGTIDAYRTRFAEGIRLLANLRQMFKASDWATGPRLVSDIKMYLTPRLYPRRDRSPPEIWDRLRTRCSQNCGDLLEQCFFALAAKSGGGVFDFAGFQARAFEHILENYAGSGFSGSVICAGTGSGKTKAFYVPAFLGIVPELGDEAFTKVIAIYPRNVLLADQLREAIAEAEKLRPVLATEDLRPIRFGALLGDTPYDWWFESDTAKSYHWKRRANGAVIPYLKSPLDGRSDLIWRDEDRRAGRTCLYRHGASEPDVPHGVLAMTREQLMAEPPDILFLSVEMLNREIGNPRWQRTFGIRRGPRSPRLILLDEVHSYQGLAGAQVAWVLRRWRHWSRASSLHITGLSATLRDAAQHLARVFAISPPNVQEFRPEPGLAPDGELEAEGVEYNLAVKGDPAAGASLLGTSIQTGMLLSRLLTPRYQAPSGDDVEIRPEEFYRKKVFGFSDNLDSINRWFNDMVDAETNLRLARLRSVPSAATPELLRRRQFQEGQVWELPIRLGYDLNLPLDVSRCSSQDPGADTNSDLIIATSSLEVGFDDPEVGTVVHHKRPISMSSFIQRKGRAGRTRIARPATVVILSDYGGDRWAFQTAERLFLPEVDALSLPISNPYVIRVQMAQFLIDWIGFRVGGPYSAFRYLQGFDANPAIRDAQNHAANLLRAVLEQGPTWRTFREDFWRFFRRFSGLPEDVAAQQFEDILWQEPRPLLTQVIPNLLRKLETEWSLAYPYVGATREDAGAGRPLPQFIPKTTFSELDIGEAVVQLEAFRNLVREPQMMAISRLLFEICPGRVSKRFATAQGEPGYWHSFSQRLGPGENVGAVAELFRNYTSLEMVDGVTVYQPEMAEAVHRPTNIADSSNAAWIWNLCARCFGVGEALPVRTEGPWNRIFSEAQVFLHSNGEWLEMLRYAEECRFDIRSHGNSTAGRLMLRSQVGDEPVCDEAIGFRVRVDGFRMVISADHLDSPPNLGPDMTLRFRTDYFSHRLRCSPILSGLINSFEADWLAQTSLSMLTAEALRSNADLSEAQQALTANRATAAQEVLDVIFQIRGISLSGQEEDARLQKTLADLWANPVISAEITRLERLLWDPPDDDFETWFTRRYAATLAQGLRAAMVRMSPQVAEDDLVVDVVFAAGGPCEILVTELSPGGVGQVETIAREIHRQPRRFLDAIEHAIIHCPREKAVDNLLAVAAIAARESKTGGPMADAFGSVRLANGFSEAEQAKVELCSAIQGLGFPGARSFIVAVMTKLLRSASSSVTDRLTHFLNGAWTRANRRMGVAIPHRTFAYASTRQRRLQPILEAFFSSISGGEPSTPAQIFAQLQQLLLEPCRDSCPECLDQPGRFYDLGKPSRALALSWLGLDIEEVSLEIYPNDWLERVRDILRRHGRARVTATPHLRGALSDGLLPLIATEIELEEIRTPVTINAVEQRGNNMSVIMQIRDFVHVQP